MIRFLAKNEKGKVSGFSISRFLSKNINLEVAEMPKNSYYYLLRANMMMFDFKFKLK